MTVIETIRNRRSVRKFTDEEISQDDINLLKEAALRSPSSRDNKPWKFYFVKNPELIKGLAESKESGSDLIRNAKLAVVVAANENSSDVWIEDCSIAAIFIQLTAQTLGLGSCWVQIRNRNSHSMTSQDFIKELLGIKENEKILAIIAIGYPEEIKKPIEYHELDFTKIKDL